MRLSHPRPRREESAVCPERRSWGGRAAALLAGAVLLAVAAGHGSLAFFEQRADADDAVTFHSGTASLDLGEIAWTPPATSPALYPGASDTGSAALTNTGDVPLSVTPTVTVATGSSAFAVAVRFTAWLVDEDATCGSPTGGAWSGTTASAGSSLGTLAAQASAQLCLRVALPSDATAGTQVTTTPSFTLTLTGDQQKS